MKRALLMSVALLCTYFAASGAEIINPTYFSVPAYVMQGVSDHDIAYAAPLDGIAELGFYPVLDAGQLEELEWSVTANDPSLIGVAIEDSTLFIWGADGNSSGSGSVQLAVSNAFGETDSITIPVTVFRDDRTLISGEGKKDYFVPWSPQLDINRISSVETHMQTYGKGEGDLDRSTNWGRWRQLEFMDAVNCGIRWANELVWPWWSQAKQFQYVDLVLGELQRMGVRYLKLDPPYFMDGLEATDIVPLYGGNHSPSWRDDELRYVINEAHRMGFHVLGSSQIWPLDKDGSGLLSRQLLHPASWNGWVANYIQLQCNLGATYFRTGVEMVCPGVELENLARNASGSEYVTDDAWNSALIRACEAVRGVFPGPLTYAPIELVSARRDLSAYQHILPLLKALDIVGFNAYYFPLAHSCSPSLAELVGSWQVFRMQVIDPLVAALGKPFVFTEAAANSVDCVLARGNGSETGRADMGEQALYVQSLMDAFRGDPAYFGTFWWEYTFVPGAGGMRDRSATIRLKPASELVAEAYGGIPDSATAVVLDGDGGEWSTNYRLAEDRVGDQRLPSKPDASSLYGQISDGYLYLMVRFAMPVTDDRLEYSLFYIGHRRGGDPDFMVPFGINAAGYTQVVVDSLPTGDVVGYGDGAFAGTDFEVRIPLGLFPDADQLYVSFGNHSVEDGSVVWNDAIGWDTGTYYGPVRSR